MSKAKALAHLMSMMQDDEEDDAKPLPSLEGQEALLAEFIGIHTAEAAALAVGDKVERNELGKRRYTYPEGRQMAVVSLVFDKPLIDEKGDICHGEVAMVHGGGIITAFPVDFRYYRRVA